MREGNKHDGDSEQREEGDDRRSGLEVVEHAGEVFEEIEWFLGFCFKDLACEEIRFFELLILKNLFRRLMRSCPNILFFGVGCDKLVEEVDEELLEVAYVEVGGALVT